jgi:hypothetical protein
MVGPFTTNLSPLKEKRRVSEIIRAALELNPPGGGS